MRTTTLKMIAVGVPVLLALAALMVSSLARPMVSSIHIDVSWLTSWISRPAEAPVIEQQGFSTTAMSYDIGALPQVNQPSKQPGWRAVMAGGTTLFLYCANNNMYFGWQHESKWDFYKFPSCTPPEPSEWSKIFAGFKDRVKQAVESFGMPEDIGTIVANDLEAGLPFFK